MNALNSRPSSVPSLTEAVATEVKDLGYSRDILERDLGDMKKKQELVQSVRKKLEEKHPGSPALHDSKAIEEVLKDVSRVLETKKSFLGKVWDNVKAAMGKVADVARWTWNNALKPVLKSPYFWTVVAALLLYFFLQMPAPPGPGGFRDDLLQQHREILEKVGTSLPQASTEAVAKVGATGGPVAQEVVKQAAEILQSPSNVMEQTENLRRLAEEMQKMNKQLGAAPR